MDAAELIAYCRDHSDDIFVRVDRGMAFQSLPLTDLSAREVLAFLAGWLAGGPPYRLATESGESLPKPDAPSSTGQGT